MDKDKYIESYLLIAQKAGKAYKLNPVIILSQSAVESGWGTSKLATNANNFFGITASGKNNKYWDGGHITIWFSKLDKKIIFRKYSSITDSFYDYARLIRENYSSSAEVSFNIQSYALSISQSPYISEKNDDNREAYRRAIEANALYIESYLKKKISLHKKVLQELQFGQQLGLALY